MASGFEMYRNDMRTPSLERRSSSGGIQQGPQRYGSVQSRRGSISGALEKPAHTRGTTGDAPEKPPPSVIEELEKDDTFSKFLADDFNATQFASHALKSGSAAASSRKLQEGIQLLEKQLRSEVVYRHDELLTQVASLKDTENVLAVVRAGVESLQASVQRVRSELADPYKQIKSKTRQLAALHTTVELLRNVTRVLKLARKLKEQMSVGSSGRIDLAKAAQLYSEVESIRKEADMSNVEVVEAELPWLAEVGARIRAEALRSLEAGMESLNQAEVGSVLQVFYNMGELRQTVDHLLGKYRAQVTKAISSALDMKAISADQRNAPGPGGVSRAGTPGLGAAPKARDALWQRLGQSSETVHQVMMAVWHLQRVLAKKRDPITHVLFLAEAVPAGEAMPTERTWEAFARSLANQMKAAFTASSFVKETFVSWYPKLAAMFEAMLDRLARDTDVKGVPAAVRAEERALLWAALEPFQTAYLGQSLSRLTDAVNFAFPSTRGGTASSEQMSRVASRIIEEVEAVSADEALTHAVVKGVGKALQLLAEKAEYQVATGPDARQVAGPATPSQLRNFALCIHLQEFHARIAALLPTLPSDQTADIIERGLGAVQRVATDAVTPLFKAMGEQIENCLLAMHDQDFGSDVLGVEAEDATNCSKYMEEVQKAILLFRSEFLSKLFAGAPPLKLGGTGGDANLGVSLTRQLASRTLHFFVRHAALVRPLSEAGKLRMARDMAELELVVGQNLFPVEQLGAPYRALRAFRPLLFLETGSIPSSPILHDLPPSAILHHLYTRAPDELQSPYQRANTTPAKYSLWLDQHTEEETWKGVKATLDAYARRVTARGDKEFSPIYPLMTQLGPTLIHGGTSST